MIYVLAKMWIRELDNLLNRLLDPFLSDEQEPEEGKEFRLSGPDYLIKWEWVWKKGKYDYWVLVFKLLDVPDFGLALNHIKEKAKIVFTEQEKDDDMLGLVGYDGPVSEENLTKLEELGFYKGFPGWQIDARVI